MKRRLHILCQLRASIIYRESPEPVAGILGAAYYKKFCLRGSVGKIAGQLELQPPPPWRVWLLSVLLLLIRVIVEIQEKRPTVSVEIALHFQAVHLFYGLHCSYI